MELLQVMGRETNTWCTWLWVTSYMPLRISHLTLGPPVPGLAK